MREENKKNKKKNRTFLIFYGLTFLLFLGSGVLFAFRMTSMYQGEEYYRQLGLASFDLENTNRVTAVEQENPLPELSCRLLQAAGDCPGIALWLQIPDTGVDYPVMLAEDNRYYLKHLPDGTKNVSGSLFLDYRTNADSTNVIIYGHNSSGDKMFGSLRQYESPDYREKHPDILIATDKGVYVCPVFSVRHVPANADAYALEWESDEQRTAYMEQAVRESLYPIPVSWSDAAGIVTLSTCTAAPSKRLLVQALWGVDCFSCG